MDLNKLFQYITNQVTDVELILIDSNSSTKIKVHKTILAFSCDYFYKLFVFNKNQSEFTIHVNNIDVAHHIILSFYGQKINYAQAFISNMATNLEL